MFTMDIQLAIAISRIEACTPGNKLERNKDTDYSNEDVFLKPRRTWIATSHTIITYTSKDSTAIKPPFQHKKGTIKNHNHLDYKKRLRIDIKDTRKRGMDGRKEKG